MKAWHFVGDRLRDGRPVPADGVKLVHDGPLVMCESGLHASVHPFDALQYAPGDTLCYVECGGSIILCQDKLVCRERTIIKRMDFTVPLRAFARQMALDVSHLLPQDIDPVALEWLWSGDESLRAAAWTAAMDAAWDAARDAAWDAARDAARDAAWDAAWTAARDAAWAAAWTAARDAARDAARYAFLSLVHWEFFR